MQKHSLTLGALAALTLAGACTRGEARSLDKTPTAPTMAVAPIAGNDTSIHWGPAPAIFQPGAQFAVLAGDPSSSGEFTVRLRLPNGYRIAPHTHPTDEHVTVIAGTFLVGMGEKFDAKATMALRNGGFVTAPAGHAHFAEARGETIVQVNGMGPFALTYVNPADTPSAALSK